MKYLLRSIPSLGCSISMWILAGLWHSLIVPGFYQEAHGADHSGVGIIILAYIFLGLMMYIMYGIWRNSNQFPKDHPLWGNLAFGMLVGVLWTFPNELVRAGAHNSSILYVFLNTAWHLIEQGVGGVVLGHLASKYNTFNI